MKRRGKLSFLKVGGADIVNAHAVTELTDFRLEAVQHRRGKMRMIEERRRQQRDLAAFPAVPFRLQ